MSKVRIAVLRTDLKWGERNSALNSPVALAIARVFPGLSRYVVVGEATIGRNRVQLVQRVNAFLRKWNRPNSRPDEFQPFVFVVDCPDRLAAQARKRKSHTRKK